MKIDSVYHGPTQSAFVKRVNGSIQRDKRMKMNNTMTDVNSKLDKWQNLKSGRRKTPGMNTSRSKVSNSSARINMREFKPTQNVDDDHKVTMADHAFSRENDEYFNTGIYNKNRRF
jgi:hypothetical protein